MSHETGIWQKQFRDELLAIARQYTENEYRNTRDTRTAFEEALNSLRENYDKRLDDIAAAERKQYDADFRQNELAKIDERERASWNKTKASKNLFSNRAIELREREEIKAGSYRDSDNYRQGMQDLVEQQAERTEKVNQSFQKVEDLLNSRFPLDQQKENEFRRDFS